jgi:hypothetical protein
MADYRIQWMQKAKIDYFAPFISLWLACNSWYNSHYSELLPCQDRKLIDTLKNDSTRRNHLYKQFDDCINNGDLKKKLNFRNNLELLHYSLERAELKPEKFKKICSFNSLCIDYSTKDDETTYYNIIKQPRIDFRLNTDNSIHLDDINDVIELDKIYIDSDLKKVFAGLFELIYQVRNLVIHGHIKPEKDEHEVVKYCYLILADLMNME